ERRQKLRNGRCDTGERRTDSRDNRGQRLTETGQYPEQLTEEIHAFGAGEEVRDALHQLTDHAQNRLAAGVGRRPDSPEDVDNRADDRAQLLEDSDGALDPAD